MSEIKLYNDDCIQTMRDIQEASVDMILCDLPYGVTARNKWDVVLPFDTLWNEYNRIIKDNGAIILFGQGLFTAKCILSNPKMFRYTLVWNKVLATGFLNANRMPLRAHEDIMVFYKKLPVYNPQKIEGMPCHSKGKAVGEMALNVSNCRDYNNYKIIDSVGNMKHPTSILEFQKPHPSVAVHPTEKPVALLEWLINTYTNEGETVLDNCMGSGSTGVACVNTNRNFIGIELDENYFKIAKRRIKD